MSLASSPRSSTASSANTSNSSDIGSVKKAKRGRPLKEDKGPVSEQRRKQVRQAQEAFRRRKKAEIESLENHVVVLEDCIEQMSNVFLDFTNSMFKSEALQKDEKLKQHLLTATSRIIALAKSASPETDAEGNPQVESKPVATHFEESIGIDSGSVPDWIDVHDAGKMDSAFNQEIPVFTPPRSPTANQSLIPARLNSPSLASSNIFGDGFFGQKPRLVEHFPINVPRNIILENTLSVRLVESTLSTAYLALLGNQRNLDYLMKHIFRFSLLYHTKEELLFNIRWFLGPGNSSLKFLGKAYFGDDPILADATDFTKFGIGWPGELSPFVNTSAVEEGYSDSGEGEILNAYDVEEYLKKKGAFYIDQKIIKMEVPVSEENFAAQTSMSPDGFQPSDFSQNQHNSPEFSEESQLGSTDNAQKFFNFAALLDDFSSSTPDTSNSFPSNTTAPRRQVVALNVPLLLQNLAHISICLAKGPAYPRKGVDHAIASSSYILEEE